MPPNTITSTVWFQHTNPGGIQTFSLWQCPSHWLMYVRQVSPLVDLGPGGDSPALTSTRSGAQQTETLLCVPFTSQPIFPLTDSSESLFRLFRALLVASGRNTTQTNLWREGREEKRKGGGRAKGRLRKGILLAHRLGGGRSSHVAGWRSHWFI